MKSNTIQICSCLTAGALCFLPLVFGRLLSYSSSPLPAALSSEMNRDMAVSALTLVVPIMMSIATDIFTAIYLRDESKELRAHVEGELLNIPERFLLAFGILVSPIPAFFNMHTPHLINMCFCMRKCRLLLVGGTIMISLCRYDPKHWSVKKTYFALVLLSIAAITGSFALNSSSAQTEDDVATKVASAFLLCSVVLFYTCCFGWLRSVRPKLLQQCLFRNNTRTFRNTTTSDNSNHLLFPTLYVIVACMAGITVIIASLVLPSYKYGKNALFFDNMANILFLLLIMYISDRMSKHEALRGVVSNSASSLLFTLLYSRKTIILSHNCATYSFYLSLLSSASFSWHALLLSSTLRS